VVGKSRDGGVKGGLMFECNVVGYTVGVDLLVARKCTRLRERNYLSSGEMFFWFYSIG